MNLHRILLLSAVLLLASACAEAQRPRAVFDTTAGPITCVLFDKEAPKTVANFIGLAEGTKDWTNPRTRKKQTGVPLYTGTIFHRVIPNFMIQGGDPIGNGTGSPGYRFEDEFVPTLRFDRPGRLAMANSGPNSNGSQFFITEVPTPHLNDRHTIFGQCDAASVKLVRVIARQPTDQRNDRPVEPVMIKKITILRGTEAAPGTPAKPGAAPAPGSKPAAPAAQKPAAQPADNKKKQ